MIEEMNEINEEKLVRLKLLSKRLDNNFIIPGTKYKIGLDPIIGAIPVIGDLIGALLSTYIMYSGIKMGVSRSIVAQMATNIALDFAIGWIPIIGDIFDIIWKANQRNVKLIEESIVVEEKESATANYMIIAGLVIVLIVTIFVILAVIS
tara:strand:- start:1050 stop:1499 length:450 start_codon:yes stop_codon:yes gene_type:complete